MRARSRWVAGTAVVVLAVGCGLVPTPRDEAARDAERAAERAGLVMVQLDRVHLAEDLARRAVALASQGMRVDVMEAHGDEWTRDAVVVLRLTISGPYGMKGADVTVVRCFRYDIVHAADDHLAHPVDCPSNAPITLPSLTPGATLPRGADETVRKVLAALPSSARADPETVRAAVDAAVGDRGVTVRAARGGGQTGVAVHAGAYDCVMARATSRDVRVWRPSPVYLQPGKAGCDPGVAATGGDLPPPR